MRAVISTVVLVTACVASPRGADTFESGMTMGADTSSSDESTSTLEGTSSSSSSGSSDDTAGLEGPNLDVAAPETDGNPGEIAEVFGHSGDTLYRMDADTKEVTTIGTFTGVMSGSI